MDGRVDQSNDDQRRTDLAALLALLGGLFGGVFALQLLNIAQYRGAAWLCAAYTIFNVGFLLVFMVLAGRSFVLPWWRGQNNHARRRTDGAQPPAQDHQREPNTNDAPDPSIVTAPPTSINDNATPSDESIPILRTSTSGDSQTPATSTTRVSLENVSITVTTPSKSQNIVVTRDADTIVLDIRLS